MALISSSQEEPATEAAAAAAARSALLPSYRRDKRLESSLQLALAGLRASSRLARLAGHLRAGREARSLEPGAPLLLRRAPQCPSVLAMAVGSPWWVLAAGSCTMRHCAGSCRLLLAGAAIACPCSVKLGSAPIAKAAATLPTRRAACARHRRCPAVTTRPQEQERMHSRLCPTRGRKHVQSILCPTLPSALQGPGSSGQHAAGRHSAGRAGRLADLPRRPVGSTAGAAYVAPGPHLPRQRRVEGLLHSAEPGQQVRRPNDLLPGLAGQLGAARMHHTFCSPCPPTSPAARLWRRPTARACSTTS